MAVALVISSIRFPAGTSVGLYYARDEEERVRAGQVPSTSALQTAVVAANGSLTFVGLPADTEFYAYAQVSGENRWVGAATGDDDEVSTAAYVDTADYVDLATMTAGQVTAGLQQAINDSIAAARGLLWRSGVYPTTATLTWAAPTCVIECEAGYFPGLGTPTGAVLEPPAGSDGLVIGDGTPYGVPTGHIRGLTVQGPSALPTDGKAGIKLNGISRFRVEDCHVLNFDIGFDLTGNCFGTDYYNCSTSASAVNVGVNVREGNQSGNDITFFNCWLQGEVAAAHIAPNADNIRFFAGQLVGPQSLGAPDDLRAAMIVNKDYLTGAIAGSTGQVIVSSVSFEATQRAHLIRSFGAAFAVVLRDCKALANHTNAAISVIKATALGGGVIDVQNLNVQGAYSAAKLIDIAGAVTAPNVYERGTAINATVNGSPYQGASMLAQSGQKGVVVAPALVDGGVHRATSADYPTKGKGLEVAYDPATDLGYLLAYNRDTAAYKTLLLYGLAIALGTSGTNRLTIGLDSASNPYVSLDANLGLGTATPVDPTDSAGIKNVVALKNVTVVPTKNQPDGGGMFYVQGGALKYRGSSGTITTVAPA